MQRNYYNAFRCAIELKVVNCSYKMFKESKNYFKMNNPIYNLARLEQRSVYMVCYVGDIITVNEKDEVARYLVEDEGRIVFVGNELPDEFKGVKKIELNGKALIPSFADTHQHFASLSTFNAGLNVMEATSNKEMLSWIKDFASKSKEKTLICFGASPYSVIEKRLVSREELDSVCPGSELMVVKYDGHACIVNSKLLKKLDKKLRALRGYHPDTGEMNQEAFFAVSDYITGSLSLTKLFRNMQKCVDYQASKGIAMVNTVSGVGFVGNLDITLEKLFAKSLNNGFQIRVFPQSMNVKVAKRRKLKRIGGCFECALDGCFGSHDASLNEPYSDEIGGNGVLYYDDEKVISFCKEANRAGLQMEMHAIGDKAFDQATKALKAALDDYPRKDHRHGIIHDCLPTSEGIAICKEYGIQMPMQSSFIDWKQEPNEYLEGILGKERLSKLNPIKTYLDNGIMVSFGSDGPCTDPDPIMWMDRAVNNGNEFERVSIKDALRMCTINGYRATFDDDLWGSLEKGKVADMVVLSSNPYALESKDVKNLKVEQLLLAGKPYQSCQRSVLRAFFSSLISKNRY